MQNETEKIDSPEANPKVDSPEPPLRGQPPSLRQHGRALLLLLAATSILYGTGLGATDFWAPDEPRYGAIAEEMRSFRHGASGLILLHLNDAAYTQKPPLYFWLAAGFGAPFERVRETAARLPSAIAGVGAVALTAWIGLIFFRRPAAALLAAGLLATSFRFAFTARRVQLDVLLTGLELAAIALFVYLEFRRGGVERARAHPLAIAGIHFFLGAAALTKGPVGWLPFLVFAAYLMWQGRGRAFRSLAPVWAWALSVGPIALWIASAIALAPSGFAESAIGENLLGRFFAGTSHARPFYYFGLQLPVDFLPWSFLLPFAIAPLLRSARRQTTEAREDVSVPSGSAARFLIVWVMVPLLFFSLSAGKRGVYLLPIFPALSLITVLAMARTSSLANEHAHAIRKLAVVVALVATIEFGLFVFGLPMLNEEKSPRPIAEAATARTIAGEEVGVYGMRALEGGIGYYGDRPIASLADQIALRSFFERGGRHVILRDRHFDSLRVAFRLRAIERFRSGRRQLVLAWRDAAFPRRETR